MLVHLIMPLELTNSFGQFIIKLIPHSYLIPIGYFLHASLSVYIYIGDQVLQVSKREGEDELIMVRLLLLRVISSFIRCCLLAGHMRPHGEYNYNYNVSSL